MAEAAGAETSLDAIFGGRLKLRQFAAGHRVGADAVLLAAAAGPPARRFVDVGAGVGAVGLSLLQRWPEASGALIELDCDLAALAQDNARLNGLASRAQIAALDVRDARARRDADLADGKADLVVTNPPFFEAGTVRASPDARKARAHVAVGRDGVSALEAWVAASLALLAPGGRFVMIHRADALGAILAAIGRRLGGVALLPIHPKAEQSAHRLLISGAKGSRAPLRIAPPLVLHEASGAFTERAEAIHRGEATIDWPA
ncbi:MAG TPA: methyltransferase [Roseiarcus sp.]|jgi:tRNA1(Val) A37 N6-methylase TrmN6